MENIKIWSKCLELLKKDLSAIDFNNWILPLHQVVNEHTLTLLAPNRFVEDKINNELLETIVNCVNSISNDDNFRVILKIGSNQATPMPLNTSKIIENDRVSNVNSNFLFDNYVEGSSNQLAFAAAKQVALNPGSAYNPLFIYGGVGLGKTHLMHAIGNLMVKNKPCKVMYLHSERFVGDMVKSIQTKSMSDFKERYRNIDALLIDDIQFFSGKERSQEEFFHTFNALLEADQQVIMTSDQFPKEIDGVEERLKSRFGWGLTVSIDPPELETRVAILQSKAIEHGLVLSNEVAFYIAEKVRSNVRELEGALKKIVAFSRFKNISEINFEVVKVALRDLFSSHDKYITIQSIQKEVARHYNINVSDILSKRRNRSVARPRQVAMALSKDLTKKSLPEIGDYFGGRDHSTVIHACKKIKELRLEKTDIYEDYLLIERRLTR